MIKDAEVFVPYGDYCELDVKIVDENGAPVNLTGTSIRFTVKQNLMDDDDNAIITKTTAGGDIVVLDYAGGIVKIILRPTETKIAPGTYRFDIKVYKNGEIYTVTLGKFKVEGVVWRGD